MMIDTHCHLDTKDYADVSLVIKKMQNNIMIASGCNLESNKEVIMLVNKYNNIYGTIGIHPEEIDNNYEEAIKYMIANINNPKIVGIGEIGLDYHYSKENADMQKSAFIEQIEIAKKYNKTIVIHSRDAIDDTYNILSETITNEKVVLHCYSSNYEMAKRFSRFNIMFGIGGVVTFKNAKKLVDVVREIGIDKLLLETDSPYLTPEPFRGQINEPHNIVYVAQKIAQIKNIQVEEVFEKTTKNAIHQFDLNI